MRKLNKIKLKDILFIDIETSTVVKELELDTPLFDSWEYKKRKNEETDQELIDSYKKEAALYPEFGRIVCISVGMERKGEFKAITYDNLDEATLIREFYTMLDKLSDDVIICGHAVKQFDIPYIMQRGTINGIRPHDLMDTSGLKPWEVDWILDTKELWQGTSYNRASLINLTTAFGLPSPKDGITGKEVPAYFWKDPEGNIAEISEYCEKDIKAVYDVVKFWKELKSHDYKPPVKKTLIEELFDGGSYGEEEKAKLKEHLLSQSKEQRVQTYFILESMTSTAKGKKTKITKAHIRTLKKEIDG